jgi:tetratricopeptide (TPR) repeat protein
MIGHLLVLACAVVSLQQTPVRIPDDEARDHLVKHVRAEPVTGVYANSVSADLVIGLDGTVEAVTIVTGNPLHRSAATAAFKQWRFKPFVRNGRPVRALVRFAIHVPDEPRSPEVALRETWGSLLKECLDLLNAGNPVQAEVTCRKALEAANKLPGNTALERSNALSMVGSSLLLLNRPREALTQYAEALKLAEEHRESDDADLGGAYMNMGRAHSVLKELETADTFYARAVSTLEAALKSLPSMRDVYTPRLRSALLEYARVKRARGHVDDAAALEKRAASLRLP